jgi:glucose-1-phosphate adenylyltransferase
VSRGAPPIGIGQGTTIEQAIVDKNARIGDSVRISPAGKPANFDGPNFYVRDGIVVVPKNAVIHSGSEI